MLKRTLSNYKPTITQSDLMSSLDRVPKIPASNPRVATI